MTDAAVVVPKAEGESDKPVICQYVERGDRCDSCGLTIETTEVLASPNSRDLNFQSGTTGDEDLRALGTHQVRPVC